jgi:DNA adenine methylase
MPYLRLFKYPGSKLSMIGDIEEIFLRSGCRTFVDVFGGSGSVSLNLRSSRTVFNDIDPEIVNLFKTIKSSPGPISDYLEKHIQEDSRNRRGRNSGAVDSDEGAKNNPVQPSQRKQLKGVSVERSIYFLETHITGFGGSGGTYRTRERSVSPFFRNLNHNFPEIWKKVSQFTIENLDFRTLVSKYDSPEVFFYFDPPYHSREWYSFNFREQDYSNLKDLISGIRGRYLLTVDSGDLFLEDIFGDPDYIKAYENKNQNPRSGTRPPRTKAFYTNV